MEKNEYTFTKEVEDTMACTAFAEAGEPCPISSDEEMEKKREVAAKSKEEKSVLDVVEDTMACTAFAEAGEPCPIGYEEKESVH